jgi:TPR repeat protein
MYAMSAESRGRGKVGLCAFCRALPASEAEEVERMKKCMDADNAYAFCILARDYEDGTGVQRDMAKANELYLKAGELGFEEAYFNLGNSYHYGRGVEVDKKKAKHYWELAAMNGSVQARHNLGSMEGNAGNHHRAYKHFIIAAKAGYKQSLDTVKEGFMDGIVTKDECANTLRAYQERQDEMKSDDRDIARALVNDGVMV